MCTILILFHRFGGGESGKLSPKKLELSRLLGGQLILSTLFHCFECGKCGKLFPIVFSPFSVFCRIFHQYEEIK